MAELSSYIQDIFHDFQDSRQEWETQWKECWWNFLGQYQADLNWREQSEGLDQFSRIFVKMTTLKCNTAHARIADALFRGRSLPFDYIPINTEELGISDEDAQAITRQIREDRIENFKQNDLKNELSSATLELCILGSAVMKGPVIDTREVPEVTERMIGGIPASQFQVEGMQTFDVSSTVQEFHTYLHLPLLEYYIDTNARSQSDSIGEIHFQRMLPSNFRKLARLEDYRTDAVIEASEKANLYDGDDDSRSVYLGERYAGEFDPKDMRVSVLDYWGKVPVKMLKDEGVTDIPEEYSDRDSVEANVVLAADGIIIKVMYNEFGKRPFYLCPYKKIPSTVYGHGVAWAMRDSQKVINSSIRLMIDNKALSGVGMVGINLDKINTKRTKNLKSYPRKTWYLKGNARVNEAIQPIVFPDVSGGLKDLMLEFERFADEETGIPKYSHAQQSSFLNKTATGMSMLMGAMNVNLKPVLENIDANWIEPIVQSDYEWYMAMEDGPKMPLKVKAIGTESLIAKEIRLENLMKSMQITNNPQDAVYLNRDKVYQDIFDILEVNDVVRSPEEVQAMRQQAAAEGEEPTDTREFIQFDRLYPQLHRTEQVQLLDMLGIKPAEQVQQEERASTMQHLEELAAMQGAQGVPPPGIAPGPGMAPPQGGAPGPQDIPGAPPTV